MTMRRVRGCRASRGRRSRAGFDRGSRTWIRRTAVLAAVAAVALPAAAVAAQEGAPPETRVVTLDEALSMARRRSPQLEAVRTQVEVAEQDRLSAVGAFLPNLGLSYGYSNSSSGRLDPTGQAITRSSYTAQLSGSLELFDGGRRFAQLEQASLGVRAEQAGFRQAEWETVEAVKGAYFSAVATRELAKVEADRVARQEEQLEFVRQLVSVGRATRSEILRSQVELNNARVALLGADNSARQARFELAEAIGITGPVAPEDTAALEVEPLAQESEELLRLALDAAPQLVTARAEAEAAAAGVQSAKSTYLPSLSFSGGWSWANRDFPPQNRSWGFSLQGQLPLFNGFQRESTLFRATALADAAQASERAAELALRTDLDAALGTLETARAQVALADQTVELAREDLQVTQERYRLGLATILDLQTAQINLRQAEADRIQRRFDYQLALASLETLLGTELQ